jgi:hypothetical protein
MTTTETIFAIWLGALTLLVIGFGGSNRQLRAKLNKLADSLTAEIVRINALTFPEKPKRRAPRPSKADLPIRLVPTDPAIPVGDRIDLTTPMPESVPGVLVEDFGADGGRERMALSFVAIGPDGKRSPELERIAVKWASGVGGTKPDGGEGSAA